MQEEIPNIDPIQVAFDRIKNFTTIDLPELKRRLEMHGLYRGKTFGEIQYPGEEESYRKYLFQLLGVNLSTKEQTDELIRKIDSLVEERRQSSSKS